MNVLRVLGSTLLAAALPFTLGCAARYQAASHCGDLYLLDTHTGGLRKADFSSRYTDKDTGSFSVDGFRSWQLVSGPDPMTFSEPSEEDLSHS